MRVDVSQFTSIDRLYDLLHSDLGNERRCRSKESSQPRPDRTQPSTVIKERGCGCPLIQVEALDSKSAAASQPPCQMPSTSFAGFSAT